MSAALERESEEALELKGAVSSLTVLRLRTADLERVEADLAARVERHPQIFLNAPAVVDAGLLEGVELDWERLVRAMRTVKLVPVGTANARGDQAERALAAGLGTLQLGPRLRTVEPDAPPVPAPAVPPPVPAAGSSPPIAIAPPAAARDAMTLLAPVRGGQVIYAKGTDLVVCASVNPGAQVIADGSIHVWGRLRGRALAGAQGKAEARIFCLALEAELVSVNGEYKMAEEIPDAYRGRPAQVFLEGQQVKIAPL